MSDSTVSKTKIERTFKDAEMLRVIAALETAGFPIERVVDGGTLAYMVGDGPCEGRFVTIKVVLTKEFDDETGKGFDMEEAMAEYQRKIDSAKTKAEAAELKRAEKAARAAEAKTRKEEKEAKSKAKDKATDEFDTVPVTKRDEFETVPVTEREP